MQPWSRRRHACSQLFLEPALVPRRITKTLNKTQCLFLENVFIRLPLTEATKNVTSEILVNALLTNSTHKLLFPENVSKNNKLYCTKCHIMMLYNLHPVQEV